MLVSLSAYQFKLVISKRLYPLSALHNIGCSNTSYFNFNKYSNLVYTSFIISQNQN
jgi:hypothetical protein